jgi:hypothetical protein
MLTFTELETVEKQIAAEYADYIARHDAYMSRHKAVVQILSLARTALLITQEREALANTTPTAEGSEDPQPEYGLRSGDPESTGWKLP